jgi:hypothetical protein
VNAAGDSAKTTASVGVANTPVISSFVASSLTPECGATVTITANFTNGTGTVDNGVGAVINGRAVQTGPITAATTFTLRVVNSSGNVQTSSLVVTPSPVVITGIPQGNIYVTSGSLYAFQVSVSGAVDTRVGWSVDGVSGGNTSSGTINNMGVYTASATPGIHVLKVVSLIDGSAAVTGTIQVVAVPSIASFTVK